MWCELTMSDVHKILNPETSSVFKVPKFPTRRWNQVTTENSTTDILSVNRCLSIIRKNGFHAKKRICVESKNKYKNYGKFYRIYFKHKK